MGPESTPSGHDPTLVGTVGPGSSRTAVIGPTLERGDTIGRYLVVQTIGRGASGVVVAAYDADLDRRVAIKVLAQRSSDQAERRKAQLAEAQAMAKIRHPNVVAVYDVGTHDERLYIAMELIEGQTLGRWCAEAGRTRAEILDAYADAARGLAAAHSAGLVHRDFKPENVLVDRDGRVRVADFGLAASVDDVARTGSMVSGTPAYMSPEHHSGSVDAKSDQFSFCVALCEALTGRRPFVGSTLAELAAKTVDGTLDPGIVALLPSRVRPIVLRGLAPAPSNRHPSMDTLALALDSARRPRWPWIVGGAATLATVGALSFALRPPEQLSACTSGGARIAESWSDEQRAEIRIAPGEYTQAYATAMREHLVATLDAWSARWAEVHDRVCASATQGGADSTIGARRACVEDRLASFAGTTALVGTRELDVDAIDRLLTVLPDPSECERKDVVAWEPVPPEPELAAQVAALRARMRDVVLMRAAAEYDAGEAEAKAIVAAARDTGYSHVIAASLRELANFDDVRERMDDERRNLDEAIEVAIASGHDYLAATIVIDRMEHSASHPGHEDGAEAWPLVARALIRRSGEDQMLVGRLHAALGTQALNRTSFANAVSHEEAALAAYGLLDDPDPRTLGIAHLNLALALAQVNRPKDSWAHALEGRRLLEAGRPSARDLLRVMHLFSVLESSLGRPDAAIAQYETTLEKSIAFFGPRNRLVSGVAYNMALSLAIRGRDAEARARMLHSRASWPVVGDAFADGEFELGEHVLDYMAGEPEAALAHLDRAIELWSDGLVVHERSIAAARHARGRSLVAIGRHAEALAIFEAEYRRWGPTMYVDADDFVDAMVATRALGDHAARALWLARSEGTLARAGAAPAVHAFLHALAVDEPDTATVQAMRDARAKFAEVHFDRHPRVRQMDAWLAAAPTRN